MKNKKVHIITVHWINNFGSLFQSYALQEFLSINGFDVEIIDYRPKYKKFSLKNFLNWCINPWGLYTQEKKYKRAIGNILKLSAKRYKKASELIFKKEEKDIFIAGGDQIWNEHYGWGKDDAFKLKFTSSKRKGTFGSSMGHNKYSDSDYDRIASITKDFSFIGLREISSSSKLQEKLNIPVRNVIDPVLLFKKDKYLNMIDGQHRLIKEPYLLMYMSARTELLERTVCTIAKEKGLKIVHVCGGVKKCSNDYMIKDAGPYDMLNLVAHADFVVSSSYHASVFSLIFNKEFCVLLPNNLTQSRFTDLLNKLELSERIISSMDEIERLNKKIDYNKTNILIDDFVSQSKHFLLENISKI